MFSISEFRKHCKLSLQRKLSLELLLCDFLFVVVLFKVSEVKAWPRSEAINNSPFALLLNLRFVPRLDKRFRDAENLSPHLFHFPALI